MDKLVTFFQENTFLMENQKSFIYTYFNRLQSKNYSKRKYYLSAYMKSYIDSHINNPSLQQSSHQSQDEVGKEKRDCIPNTTPSSPITLQSKVEKPRKTKGLTACASFRSACFFQFLDSSKENPDSYALRLFK